MAKIKIHLKGNGKFEGGKKAYKWQEFRGRWPKPYTFFRHRNWKCMKTEYWRLQNTDSLLPWSWNTRRLSPRSPATFPLLLSSIWSTSKSRRPRSRDKGANRPNLVSTSPRTGDKVSLTSGLAINWPACDLITAFNQRTAILLLQAAKQHISHSQTLTNKTTYIVRIVVLCYWICYCISARSWKMTKAILLFKVWISQMFFWEAYG